MVSTRVDGWWAPPAVDASPKKFGLARKLVPWVSAAVRLIIALRVVTGPFLVFPVLVIVTALFGPLTLPPWLALVGPLVVMVGAPVLAFSCPWYRRRLAAGWVSTRILAFRLWWPTLCGLCHLTVPGARRMRVPTLVSVEFGSGWGRPEWIRLEVFPLGLHERTEWARYPDRIGRQMRYADSVWAPSAGKLRMTLLREELPTSILVGSDVPASSIGQTHDQGQFRATDEVVIGRSTGGGQAVWCPDEDGRHSMFLAGASGGGKSELARRILAHATVADWECYVAAPKGLGDFLPFLGVASVEDDPMAMVAMVVHVAGEMMRRAELLTSKFRVAKWSDVPLVELEAEGMARRVLLMVDEAVVLLGLVRMLPPPEKGAVPPVQVLEQALQSVTAMGRSLGVSVVMMTQHPIAEHLGRFGSTMKANLGARIMLGACEAEGASALFGKSHGEDVAAALNPLIAGRMAFTGLRLGDSARWQLGQAYYATPHLIESVVPQITSGRPRKFGPVDTINQADVVDINGRVAS